MVERLKNLPEKNFLPSFEEIVGFLNIPEKDIEDIKSQYIGPYVESFIKYLDEYINLPINTDLTKRLEVLQNDDSPNLLELLRKYFAEKVYKPLFNELIKIIPEFKELRDNPIKFSKDGISKDEMQRMDKFAEISKKPEIAPILEEYGSLQEKAQEIFISTLKQIGDEALSQAEIVWKERKNIK